MADPCDVLTLAEARTILSYGASDTTNDATIARVVTTISRRLDTYCGPIVQRSVTSEIHDGYGTRIELGLGPVSAISTVTEYSGTTATVLTAETPGVEPGDGYYAERYAPNTTLLSGMLIRRAGGHDSCWAHGRGNIQIGYLAGRATATTTVDPIYKEAGALMLRNLWRSYQQSIGGVDEYDVPVQNFPTFTIPRAVVELLADEVQPTVGFG